MNDVDVGEIAINLKIKLDALEKGIETAKKKLEEIENQNEKVNKSNKDLELGYIALAGVAVKALSQISGAIKDSVDQYNSYIQAMSSLRDVVGYTGQSMSEFASIMSDFSIYMTQDDLAATIKNFTLMGYSADDTRKMIEALTNSAIKNRNANYTVSQAVKVASDGYRQGLSTLSDSAGVTENLSVMLDNYAKSIGKTASQLTEAEQNQAYLTRTMKSAEPFMGAMSEYADTLAGKQEAYNQAMREAQVAYAEALQPVLSESTELMTNLLQGITKIIEENPALVAGITAAGIALGVATIATIALKKAKDAYTKSTIAATIAEQGFNAALMANPIMAVIAAITLLVGATVAIATAVEQYRTAQEKLNETNERAKAIEAGKYEYKTDNAKVIEDEISTLEELIKKREELAKKEQEVEDIRDYQVKYTILGKDMKKNWELNMQTQEIEEEMKKLRKEIKETEKETGIYLSTVDELNEKLETDKKWMEEYNNIQKVATFLDTEAIRTKKKEASQTVLTAQEHKKYLETIKTATKGTKEYEEAVDALAKVYPEAVSANGPLINELDELIKKENDAADDTYNSTQSMIESYKNFLAEVKGSETKLQEAAAVLQIPVNELIPKLENAIALYEILYGKSAGDMGGTSYKKTTTSGTSSYQNKALDDYKKQIEYKKNLDKISAEEEIEMYEYALRNLAKINDEKMDLEVEIYKLRKQLIEDYIDSEKELLDIRTENSERWIQEQRLSSKEQEEAYDRIIAYHKEYLDKMVADERLSLEQKDKIWREEVNTIKDYQRQIREIRIESANNVYEALKSALVKQADSLQEIEENAINKSLESLEKAKNKRIAAIKEEYDARIKAIEGELKALDDAQEQKSRMEEDEEYEKKKKRLEDLIAYEHDAITRSSYEKELAKLNADYKKTLDKREYEDKKEALQDEKNNLKEEETAKLDSVNAKYDKDKEYLNKRLKAIQANYDKERELADKNAQIMLLNTERYQNEIINLLKKYGDEYELLGTTWGERLVDAFEEQAKKVLNLVDQMQEKINQTVNNKISQLSDSNVSESRRVYAAEQAAYVEANRASIEAIAKEKGVDMGVATDMHKSGVVVNQTNNYNVPVEKPSALATAVKQTAQVLGELVRGSA